MKYALFFIKYVVMFRYIYIQGERTAMLVHAISPVELESAMASGKTTLIDVRTPVEYREMHVQGALNIPLDSLTIDRLPAGYENNPLYLICQKGGRGTQACRMLSEAGLDHVVNVEGGTLACHLAGLPMVHGKSAISLERQVRIVAGSLIILSIALSFVHPVFLVLAAFVGAGLTFAGITDTCGMAMLLTRMPWNQFGCGGESCEVAGGRTAN